QEHFRAQVGEKLIPAQLGAAHEPDRQGQHVPDRVDNLVLILRNVDDERARLADNALQTAQDVPQAELPVNVEQTLLGHGIYFTGGCPRFATAFFHWLPGRELWFIRDTLARSLA